ncbi:PREDICTED: uncharacterized protein LOC107193254 [Dufourea novaeangliae]|uniref:uncharacterized protein LOC107193254 n=1 Tax=Dufourea novaeangliae TaxID=178035 RepID=UPI0007677F4D|nr:PREDICTED: uncharacterized protein LOC107193254 [Dufourea novaeangliae]
MTPLPWWVLLAFLLAGVGAQPDDYACVRLCRARNQIPEITGVCEYRQTLVLQSGVGRYPIQRLLSLCLTPCGGPGSPDSELFDGSQTCRVFREILIRQQACLCDSSRDDSLENNPADVLLPKNSLDDDDDPEELKRWRSIKLLTILKKITEDQSLVPINSAERNIPVEDKMILEEEDEEESVFGEDWLNSRIAGFVHLNPDTPDESDSTELPVDWDMWCMTQCDNGQGGTACNCDLIP